MKKLIFLFVLLLIGVIGVFADSIVATDTTFANPHVIDPNAVPIGGAWHEWVNWAIIVVLALWEIVLRIIPTSKDWTIISKVVSILNWIVSLFNGVGNAAKTTDGSKKAFKTTVK